MKKVVATLVLLLFSCQGVQAGPIEWIKRQSREHPTRTAFVVGVGAAVVHGLALRHCRQNFGPEPCDEHYGAAWAAFGFVTGANMAMIGVSDSCRKNDGGKFCNVLAYGGSAAQTGWGIHEATISVPKRDLSDIQLVH